MINIYDIILDKLQEQKNQYVIAPAGCGKTHMITNFANNYSGKILILTHTNAGVDVINSRITNDTVKVNTIASFMEKYVKKFKGIHNVDIDYSYNKRFKKIYEAFLSIMKCEIIKRILVYNYDMIFVDEYQDCTISQHNSICEISKIIPTKIFGDPMQAIFDFDKEDSLVDFDTLQESFEYLGELDYPWRWNENISLGHWLLNIRDDYKNKFKNILKRDMDSSIKVINEEDLKIHYELIRNKERNCIVTKRKQLSINICQRLAGHYTVLEELELNDLASIIKNLVNSEHMSFTLNLLKILKNSYTKSHNILNKYIEKLEQKSNDFKRLKSDDNLKSNIYALTNEYSYESTKYIITYIEKHNDTKCYRRELIINLCHLIKKIEQCKSITDGIKVFKQSIKRLEYKNVVAHTLLIKGLEFDNCIVYKKDLTPNEFYVALTRPKKKLYIVI